MVLNKRQKLFSTLGILADVITVLYFLIDVYSGNNKITMTDLFKNYFFVISFTLTLFLACTYIYWYIQFLNKAIRDHAIRIKLLNAIISENKNIDKKIAIDKIGNYLTEEEIIYLGL